MKISHRLCAPLSFEVTGKAVDDAVANFGLIQGNTLRAISSIVNGGANGYALLRLGENNRRLNYQPTRVIVAPILHSTYPYNGYNPYYPPTPGIGTNVGVNRPGIGNQPGVGQQPGLGQQPGQGGSAGVPGQQG